LLRLLIDAAPPGTIKEVKKEELMAGPGAPGSVALEQSSVDDLLADLGF
jgi:chemotaxis protein CheZ